MHQQPHTNGVLVTILFLGHIIFFPGACGGRHVSDQLHPANSVPTEETNAVGEETFRPEPHYSEDFNLAEQLYFYGDYRNAIRAYQDAVASAKKAFKPDEAAAALRRLGRLLAEIGRYPEAIRSLKEAASLSRQQDFVASTYAQLAAMEGRLGNFAQGLEHADKALDLVYKKYSASFAGKKMDAVIDEVLKNPDVPPDKAFIEAVTTAECAKVLILYFQGNYQSVVTEGERAIGHFNDMVTTIHLMPTKEQWNYVENIGFVTFMVGDSYLNLGRTRKGREYLVQARQHFKEAQQDFGDILAGALIGYSYALEKDFIKAGELFRINLARTEAAGFDDLKWRIKTRFAGLLYQEARALETSKEAINRVPDTKKGELLKMELVDKYLGKVDALSDLLDEAAAKQFSELVKSLWMAAESPSSLAHIDRLIRFLKEEAYLYYTGAIENVESLRSIMETDLNRRMFQADKQNSYSDLIEISIDLYGPAKGFEALERAKARELMDLLATRELSFKQHNLRQEETWTRESAMEELAGTRRSADDIGKQGAREKGAATGIDSLLSQYRNLLIRIKQEEPEFASLITASGLTPDAVQRMLPDDTALLEYFPTNTTLYIWALDKKDITVTALRVREKDLTAGVRNFRNAVIAGNREKSKLLANELYDILILPMKDRIKARHIGLIPHGALHELPFQALRFGNTYLIEEHPLFFSPSASVLSYAMGKAAPPGSKAVIFGNPDLGDPRMNLPFSQAEADAVAQIYPGSKVFLRMDATESAAKNGTSGYDIIHFATYAEYSAVDPLSSSVRLSVDELNDGRLESAELFSMDIKPCLVTVSAGKSGPGVVTSEAGVVGLERAFIYAGAPSLITGRWSVSDASTAKLFETFYRNLQTMSKDEALRSAQISLIRSEQFSAPYFWAAFYLTGDWR